MNTTIPVNLRSPISAPALNYNEGMPQAVLPGGGSGTVKPDTTLQDLYNSLSSQGNTMGKTTTNSTSTTKANESPSLEASIADYITKQNQISADTAAGYTGYQNSFTDMINTLRERARSTASDQASNIATSALNSGLSPFQAQGAADSTWREAMSSLLASQAGLQQQQAHVPIDAAGAQKDIQALYGDFMKSVIAPYQMGLAGTTTNQSGTSDDPSKYYTLLANLASGISNQKYQEGSLANQQQGNQISANQALWQYLLGKDTNQTNKEQIAANAASNAAQTAASIQNAQTAAGASTASALYSAQSRSAQQEAQDIQSMLRAVLGSNTSMRNADVAAQTSAENARLAAQSRTAAAGVAAGRTAAPGEDALNEAMSAAGFDVSSPASSLGVTPPSGGGAFNDILNGGMSVEDQINANLGYNQDMQWLNDVYNTSGSDTEEMW